LPFASRHARPESPGMPGVTVLTTWVQPLPSSPVLMPTFGLTAVTPRRRIELPYEYTLSPNAVPVVLSPTGPPQCGMFGLTRPASAGSILTSARSLYAHALASVSPAACMAIQEL